MLLGLPKKLAKEPLEPVKVPQRAPNKPVEDKFVKVPLWWAKQVAAATKSSRQMLVCVLLLRRAWESHSMTFPFPNVGLAKWGVSRETKRLTLVALEKAGLIKVQRRGRKSPIVTLLHLP
jgi:hypothetical protein